MTVRRSDTQVREIRSLASVYPSQKNLDIRTMKTKLPFEKVTKVHIDCYCDKGYKTEKNDETAAAYGVRDEKSTFKGVQIHTILNTVNSSILHNVGGIKDP